MIKFRTNTFHPFYRKRIRPIAIGAYFNIQLSCKPYSIIFFI